MQGTPMQSHRRGRSRRRADRQTSSIDTPKAVWPGIGGGRFKPLSDADTHSVHERVLSLWETVGLSQPIASMVERVKQHGGRLTTDNRLLFPRTLVEDVIANTRRDLILHGRKPGQELDVSGARVHFGTGGASPSIVDLDDGRYRDATVKDLYDAARLVDAMSHIHLFSRSLVARDAPNPKALDINTAYACIAGTSKHVCMSISDPAHVDAIAEICYSIAGGEAAFRAQPRRALATVGDVSGWQDQAIQQRPVLRISIELIDALRCRSYFQDSQKVTVKVTKRFKSKSHFYCINRY